MCRGKSLPISSTNVLQILDGELTKNESTQPSAVVSSHNPMNAASTAILIP